MSASAIPLQFVTFECRTDSGSFQRDGFMVPGTSESLAIDLREAHSDDSDNGIWIITHLNTGMRIPHVATGALMTRAQAARVAQSFYREMQALGVSLEMVKEPIKLTASEREDFYQRVRT